MGADDPKPEWMRIPVDRADHSPGHAMAFDLVPATCSQVGQALNLLRQEIEADYRIKPEDSVALDLAIHRAIARIKENATEPLRRALIHTCNQNHALMTSRKPIFEYDTATDEYNDTECAVHVTQTAKSTVVALAEPDVEGIDQPKIHVERRAGEWRVLVSHGDTGDTMQLVLPSNEPGAIHVHSDQ